MNWYYGAISVIHRPSAPFPEAEVAGLWSEEPINFSRQQWLKKKTTNHHQSQNKMITKYSSAGVMISQW